MITTRGEFIESLASANVVSRELAEGLYKSTRDKGLKLLLDLNTETIVINSSLRMQLVDRLRTLSEQANRIRGQRKGVGGRPKFPEPTIEEIEKMSPAELLKYKNRKWQRESRERRNGD